MKWNKKESHLNYKVNFRKVKQPHFSLYIHSLNNADPAVQAVERSDYIDEAASKSWHHGHRGGRHNGGHHGGDHHRGDGKGRHHGKLLFLFT